MLCATRHRQQDAAAMPAGCLGERAGSVLHTRLRTHRDGAGITAAATASAAPPAAAAEAEA
jgi:hypothetical protein